MRALAYAPDAWKYLNGIFCVYKPPKLNIGHVWNSLLVNLCRDINAMEKRTPKDLVLLKGSIATGQPFSVEVSSNFADHELVVGQRYQRQDIRLKAIDTLGVNTSGVMMFAVNGACKKIENIGSSTFLRKYEVKGKFGLCSRNFMDDGKIVERSTYSHIRQGGIDRLLSSIQFTHQALAYRYSGVDIQSQEAYELASKGLVRPIGRTKPILYNIKCSRLALPEFTLDIHCFNETEEFLAELVHQIGIYLKSSAVCTGLRRVQFGHFTTDIALIRKHWTLENILNNITLCKKIFDKDEFAPSSPKLEAIKPSKLNEALEYMQNESREDVL
ncbi:pseudouridylate synthase TRUB2, mitochondrial [Parasteatoda tepidariorum]|uniref:Putative tRNA pseudouridine synthase 2 n=2 Tax=Parasteatoda tepidariorum TaxID=114398 RepID=A0A2L2YL01_PARTP